MPLRPWKSEPQRWNALAIFHGPWSLLGEFARQWAMVQGDFDLLEAVALTARINSNFEPIHCCIIFFPRAPMTAMLQWLVQRRKNWHFFYRPVPDGNDGTEAPTAMPQPDLSPYLPWGFELDRPAPHLAQRVVMHNEDGFHLETYYAKRRRFFELYKEFHPSRVAGEHRPSAAPLASRDWVFPLRLIAQKDRPAPDGSGRTVDMLEREIQRLEDQRERLRFWNESERASQRPVRMWAYMEDERLGTADALRRWFAAAPEAVLKQYKHARLGVAGIGTLHLVTPVDFADPPLQTPPRPNALLERDWKWAESSHQIFISEGFELWPYPPRKNQHLRDVMAELLWERSEKTDYLAIIKRIEQPDIRFAVPLQELKPLHQQIATLNIQSAIRRAQTSRLSDFSPEDPLAAVLGQVKANLRQHLTGELEAIETALASIWNGPLADIANYRELVEKLLTEVRDIREWQRQIRELKKSSWGTWTAFVDEVLKYDLEVLPSIVSGPDQTLVGNVQKLRTSFRQVTDLWQHDTPEKRQQLAKNLRAIAASIESERR